MQKQEEQKIKNILKFLHDIERLKFSTRHSWMSDGRRESVAEHSWRVTVMALVLAEEFPKINISKVIEMLLVHDFGEVYDGDTPAFRVKDPKKKIIKEKKSIKKLVKPLSKNLQKKIISLCAEFNKAKTREAKLAKALDKLEVLFQHDEADISTWLKKEYKLNLTHGQKYMGFHEFIKNFREVVDDKTKEKISKAKPKKFVKNSQ